MKKLRKGKKMLLIILVALIVIIATIFIIKGIINKKPTEVPEDDTEQIIPLPETTYSDMQVKNVQMEYLKDNNETMISMEIHNTTQNAVEDEDLDVMLIGKDENVIGQMETSIDEKLQPGEQYDISVVLKGDLTQTKQIKLVKK